MQTKRLDQNGFGRRRPRRTTRNDGLAYLSPGSEAVDLATGHGVRHGRKRRTNRGWAAKTAFEEHRALVGFEH